MEDQPFVVGGIPDPKPTERRRLVVEDGRRYIWVDGAVRGMKTLNDVKGFLLSCGGLYLDISNPKTVIAIERQFYDGGPYETVAVLQGSWDDPPTPRDLPYPLFGEVVNSANRKYDYEDVMQEEQRKTEQMKRDPVIEEALRPLDVLVLLVFNYPFGNKEAEEIQRKNAASIRGCHAVVCPRNPTGDWPAVEKIIVPLSRG